MSGRTEALKADINLASTVQEAKRLYDAFAAAVEGELELASTYLAWRLYKLETWQPIGEAAASVVRGLQK
jgi:hypothetical protein